MDSVWRRKPYHGNRYEFFAGKDVIKCRMFLKVNLSRRASDISSPRAIII